MRETWSRLSRGRKVVLAVVAGALVVGAVVAIVLAVLPDDSDRVTVEFFWSPLDRAFYYLPTGLQTGNRLGYDDAPVKLIQFQDFQCSNCLTYAQHIEPALVEEYVRSGVLQIEIRHFPMIGRESVTGRQWELCVPLNRTSCSSTPTRLFVKQPEEGFRVDHGSFSEEELVEVAEDLEIDVKGFTACQADPATLDAVARDVASARAFGIRSVPSFVLNGTPVADPPQTVQGWRDLIHEAIEQLGVGCPNPAETEFLAETSVDTLSIGSAMATLGVYLEEVREDPSLLDDAGWLAFVRGALSDIGTGWYNIEMTESPVLRSEPIRAHLLYAAALSRRGADEIDTAFYYKDVDKLIQGSDILAAGGEAMRRATEAMEKRCE